MKIFIPAQKDANLFFDEVITNSKHTYDFNNFDKYNPTYKIVLIHWPEQIFNWKEPLDQELIALRKAIKVWKKKSRIFYVVHNLERHLGMTPNFKALYDLIIYNADEFIHLGSFSEELFKTIYPLKKHSVIFHPLYKNSFEQYCKSLARQKLGISENSLVVISPGKIRSHEEATLLKDTFNEVKRKDKILLVPNMYKKELKLEFKGRYLLKKIIDIKKIIEYFHNGLHLKKFRFSFSFVDRLTLSLMMSASDVVFIPRIKSLNSGNIFLGLTFKKIVVGPNIGNIGEFLDLFDFPKFNPKNIEESKVALKSAIELYESNSYKYINEKLENFYPINVAKKWDMLFNESLK
ncbi:hypothetical protein RM697_01700 [Ichthyenterobacterium sp. W332]|uniref:Glycosyltransferase n=1 Tax=Microcosmobacter mediterraneus TaxID=3075607 RepID=A0ABU2YHQ3_9FLAO|nr:hypothetical protein [Ichthyenterobacterium sp. W332]MDT0557342.1 hypothetical protein [Ichthyenterobacterium sp. W332]